jgi:hypothetical protein
MVDSVIIPATPPTEDPKHVEAMVAKAEAATQVPPSDDQVPSDQKQDDRPGWLPEKFKSPEELAKAYNELQQKLGKPAEPQNTDNNQQNTDQKAAEQELADRGLDFTEFSNEFSQKGELTTESYEKLEKAGIPRNLVDQYIAGQRAQAALYESEVKSVAGGDKGFSEMVDWAKSNLSPTEIAAYNAAIDSGNPDQAKLAVAGVYQKFSAARPSEPTLVQGKTSGAASGEAYESVAQLTKDMASPEYKSDPAFRARVQAKLARSSIL